MVVKIAAKVLQLQEVGDFGDEKPYEAIKVIEAWNLDFALGNVVKYINRAGKKGSKLEDLKKAQWYMNQAVEQAEKF